MHYVIQTDQGYRLFASYEAAEAFGGYEKPLEVPEGTHYRGKPGPRGVLFTSEDQSSRQFAAMLANRENQ